MNRSLNAFQIAWRVSDMSSARLYIKSTNVYLLVCLGFGFM